MKWFRRTTFRKVRKHLGRYHCVDGVYYKPRMYGKLLNLVSKLRVGDMLYGFYGTPEWVPITEIKFLWEPIGLRRRNAQYVDSVEIKLANRYLVYDIDVLMPFSLTAKLGDSRYVRESEHYAALLSKLGEAEVVDLYEEQALQRIPTQADLDADED